MHARARWTRTLAVAAALWAAPLGLQADTLWLKSATEGGKPFERANLKVLKVEGPDLVFKSLSSDQQDTKPLADIVQMKIDNEAVFSGAEAAYAAGDFVKATTEYQKAMDASRTPWVKLRSVTRVIDAASKSKNFAAAVKGYAELVKVDPTAAATVKPVIPAGGAPGSLDAAVREAGKAAGAAGITADQKSQLLTLQLELARANGDTKLVETIVQQLTGAPAAGAEVAAPGAMPAPAGTSAAGAGDANRRIQITLVSISGKQYAQALKQITDAPEVFVNPEEQVEALYCIAEAKSGLATTPDALKEAGIDYMRVVARAKATTLKSPRVLESLFKTALIHEKINANEEALLLYKQVAAEAEPNSEFATKSAAAVTRLSKKEPG